MSLYDRQYRRYQRTATVVGEQVGQRGQRAVMAYFMAMAVKVASLPPTIAGPGLCRSVIYLPDEDIGARMRPCTTMKHSGPSQVERRLW
jgi:hypothetical protein